jgi:hypothetical protein
MLAALVLAGMLAAGAAPDAARAEAKRFEGVWVCRSARMWGEALPHAEGLTWEFRADTRPRAGGGEAPPNALILRQEARRLPREKEPEYIGQLVTIDPSAEPREFDVLHLRIEGIYRFTPEGLEICELALGHRPSLFSGEKDRRGGTLYLLVRQAPKPKGDGGPGGAEKEAQKKPEKVP